jgi:hypothetical protein
MVPMREPSSVSWWFAHGMRQDDLITLESLEDVLPFLRAIPDSVVNQLLVSVAPPTFS